MLVRSALIAIFSLLALFFLVGMTMNFLSSESVAVAPGSTRLPVATSMPPITPTPEESWLILPEMPASATQADIGAEIYRLVCRDCHGDKGQGLTDEWRATWNPEDQNCWQSKCHAGNHPVNGFDLPRYVPALIGPSTLARFSEPDELQEYIRVNMPWHDPGSLTNEEYWQLTAFLLRENGKGAIELP